MKLFICVSDYWHHRQWYQLYSPEINHNNNKQTSYHFEILSHQSAGPLTNETVKRSARRNRATTAVVLKRLLFQIDGYQYFYLFRELLQFSVYRQMLYTHPSLQGVHLLWFQIIPPSKEVIDWKWNRMVAVKLWEKIETDYLMSWLSTLGGGYSALGEQFSECAQVAGKISQKQLRIGIQLGDPFLQSRCLLYYSISLIQVGRLRAAKYIIRRQYKFARTHEEYDGRLVKMCEGIWLRLQYEYGRRLRNKRKSITTKLPV